MHKNEPTIDGNIFQLLAKFYQNTKEKQALELSIYEITPIE
jgi:hypothetical protein